MSGRIGQGFDVHRWVAGRPLRLGGITIPHDQGLLGHSDADVLLHAVGDALLGAAGLGDLGHHFPDQDPDLAGIDSRILLQRILAMVQAAGFRIVNLDTTLILQRPRIAPHVAAMRESIAGCLGVDPGVVNVKATTTEGLGFTGRHEGVAAMAVVLLAPGKD